MERFEDRTVPSTSIPLNANTWTAMGPSPISVGQAPGSPSSTGRINGIAVDPTNTNVMYAATDAGGVWSTTDGGKTWTPDTDQQELDFQTIAMVHRTGGNTVYAFDQQGNLWTSTNGATTFTESTTPPFETGATVNKLAVFVTDPTDQTKDILYAAVGSIIQLPPSRFPMTPPELGSGIWRSTDGGATWTNLVDSTKAPFTNNSASPIPADSLSFSDVTTDPTNANIVYAAVGNAFGDPTNGVYKTSNALSATPTWTLLIGGAAFVPGETPGNIKLAVSPSVPSVIFASLALRLDPLTGTEPLLGVFRSLDAGVTWAPVLLTSTSDPLDDPLNALGPYGFDNDVMVIAPNSPANPMQQTVYVAGYGEDLATGATTAATVILSTNSGASWTPIGIGSNGVGTYPNVHAAGFDSQNRLILATGGGVYRLDSVTKTIAWESLNGTAGATGLDVADFNGFALNPLDPNKALGNISFVGDGGVNVGPPIHNAVLFSDTGAGAAAYGWQTVDAVGLDGNVGEGQIIYNPFNPNIVYRVVPGEIRVSTDGGQTWVESLATAPGAVVPLAIDPSQPNRLFSFDPNTGEVIATDDNGATWSQSIQIGAGEANPIPNMPTDMAGIPVTAIGVGRESGLDLGGNGVGINGVTLFVATTDDVLHDPTTPDDDPTASPAGAGAQLFVTIIPTNSFPFPGGLTWDGHSWANLKVPGLKKGETIEQIVVDPANNTTLYLFTSDGRVLRGTNFQFSYQLDANGVIFGGAPDFNPVTGAPTPLETGTATWTDITGNLPAGAFPSPVPQGIALDSQVLSDPTDDNLYAATPASGVWKLTDPTGMATPVWTEVGLNTTTTPATPTMPIAPVTAISLSTTTGILGAATYGRGVYEIQVRGLIAGHVFTDTNGNGVRDTGEAGIAGVTVEVLDENQGGAVVAATTTDSTGLYQFRSLTAGNYEVVVLGPANEIQTTAPVAFPTLTEQSNDTADFGFFKPGSISGTTFNDLNDNGVRDAGEPAVGGFTVFIDAHNDGTLDAGDPSVVTGTNGTYSFTNLGPAVIGGVANPLTVNGAYLIREVPLTGWLQTTPPLPAVTLNSGQAFAGQLIGNVRAASIAGAVFVDTNGDGTQEAGELGAAGITVQAIGPGGTLTTTTAADGTYSFAGLAPGTYIVTETLPAGFVQTTATPAPITLGPVDHITGVSFGQFKTVSLSGEVYNDANGNGVQDTGEAGLNAFILDLVNVSTGTVVTKTTSGPTGAFTFSNIGPIPGGTAYEIVEEPQTGFVQTTTNPAAFTVSSGANQTGFQFGNFQQYSISGTVYLDQNDNGAQDAGEPGIAGIVVQLLNSSNVLVASATTAANGAYAIPTVGPGTYTLVEAPVSGLMLTEGAAGYILPGQNDVNVTGQDFGNIHVAAISGTVFVDKNGNGIDDPGDAAQAGVTVQLTGPGGPQTTSTAADGSYTFNHLAAGTYTVTETVPTGFSQTTANPAPLVVGATQIVTGVVFGNFQAVSLSGEAFVDANDNGVLDSGETGLGNVVINLVNATSGAVVAHTTTASTGAFTFTNVGALAGGGDYEIREVRPTGYVQSSTNPAAFAPTSGTNQSGFLFGNTPVERTIVTGVGAGGPSTVTVRNAATDAVMSSFDAYGPSFTGGVRVATGLFSSGTTPDIVTAAGPGGGPHVELFSGTTGTVLASFYAYDASFTGGVYVAVGDVNGDGVPDIITGADAGGGPHVKVFDGASLLAGNVNVLYSFFAYNANFTGGVRVASADIDGDGFADIITGAGPGGGPHVEVFSGKTGGLIRSFFAYNGTFTGGVFVTAGDVSGTGQQDIITGPGIGGGPDLRVFNGATLALVSQAYAFPGTNAGTGAVWVSGLTVATTDINGDGIADIVVAPGPGQQPTIRVLNGATLAQDTPPGDVSVFDPFFLGGIFVGGD